MPFENAVEDQVMKQLRQNADRAFIDRVRVILTEWGKGCSNTIGDNPAACHECTEAAIEAIKNAARQEQAVNSRGQADAI